MARPKKLLETHGKVDEIPTTLDQIWGGYNETSKYGTLEEDSYKSELDEYNRTDLDAHARRMGVVIVESTARLKDKLMQEFRKHKIYLTQPRQPVNKKLENLSSEVKKILSEGR